METNRDFIDGQNVPPLIVEDNYLLEGVHQGTVIVKSGAFRISGENYGTLSIGSQVVAEIDGIQAGTVSVADGARVIVRGRLDGSVAISSGAQLIVEATGRLAGSLHNDGRLIVRGVFGGARSGAGELILQGAGYIKQPRIEKGIHYYEW